jgi:hypothetical protein
MMGRQISMAHSGSIGGYGRVPLRCGAPSTLLVRLTQIPNLG